MADCLQGILTVVPLQLLSFHIAVLKGYDVSENIAYAGHETTQVYLSLLSRFGVHSIKLFYKFGQPFITDHYEFMVDVILPL